MKTIVVLERQEIDLIMNGEPFVLRLADGSSITIQAESERVDGAERKARRKARKSRGIGNKTYRCAKCPETFDNKYALGGHSKSHRDGAATRVSAGNAVLKCPQEGCGARFVHQAWLDRHREREHG